MKYMFYAEKFLRYMLACIFRDLIVILTRNATAGHNRISAVANNSVFARFLNDLDGVLENVPSW